MAADWKACLLGGALTFLALSSAEAKNLGHRMGGDVFKPENTLVCYKRALEELQSKADFHYVELDIQESKDGRLMVFHDTKTIKRLVPKSPENLRVLAPFLKTIDFKKLRIRDLPAAIIKRLVLAKNARIPGLKEVLDASVRWKLKKPLLIEIKELRSDACRERLLDLVTPYRKKLKVDFLAFPAAFRAAFPDPARWKRAIKDRGFRVYTCRKAKTAAHDLAKDAPPPQAGLQYRTLLPATSFAVVKAEARSLSFPFSIPTVKGSERRLRVGIENAVDDSGDKGLRFRIEDGEGSILLSGFCESTDWRWFEIPLPDINRGVLVIEDQDTRLTGKKPGNGGKVKATLTYRKP